MARGKTAALVVLGIVLFVVLLSANAAITLERTALDSDYAKETAEEVNLYAALGDEIRGEIAADTPDTEPDGPLERSEGELLAAALTDEYIRSQWEANIDNVYAYLNGETDEIRFGFDPDPLEERLLTEVESDVEDIDLAAVDMPFAADIDAMAESRSAFENHRETFRADEKERIQSETDRELSDEELEARLDESMDELRDEMYAEMEAEIDGQFSGPEAALEEPIRDLQTARIDGLTGELDYEEYSSEVETATDDLGDAFVTVFESELDDELPETMDLTDEMDEDEMQALETARTIVSISGVLSYGLFVLALAFAGLIGWLASPEIAAIEVGTLSALTGIVGAAGAIVATTQLRTVFENGGPMGMEAFMLEFAVGIFETLQWQSLVLIAAGIALIAVGIALRNGYVELPERSTDR